MRIKWISPAAAGLLLGLAAEVCSAEAPAPAPTPIPSRPTPQKLSLTADEKVQARKVLAATIEKRQALQGKPAAGSPASFQAHRCAVLYDPRIFGKERELNGPFRTTCGDWVPRRSQALAVKDADQPCAVAQYGQSFAGCTSWVDRFDAGSGKWVNVWRQSSP